MLLLARRLTHDTGVYTYVEGFRACFGAFKSSLHHALERVPS